MKDDKKLNDGGLLRPSRKEIEKIKNKLKPVADLDWIRVEQVMISEEGLDLWEVVLRGKNGEGCIAIPFSSMQLTGLSYASVPGLLENSILPTLYQLVLYTSRLFGAKPSRIIIDARDGMLCHGRLELKAENGSTAYLNMMGADAVVLAKTGNIPLYVLRGLLEEDDEDD